MIYLILLSWFYSAAYEDVATRAVSAEIKKKNIISKNNVFTYATCKNNIS